MNESKAFKVSIFEQQYNLVSDESEEFITKAASLVDAYMKEIAEKSSLKDASKVAVLAGLRLASDLLKQQAAVEKSNNTQRKLVDIIDDELRSCQNAL